MAITSHDAKRDWTLRVRGLDFADAEAVFAGPTFTFEDTREDYGEQRFVTFGLLAGRLVAVGWTPRGEDQHVFSMRKANAREQAKYLSRLAP